MAVTTIMRDYYSLQDLAAELQRQQDAKVDYLTPTDSIHFISYGEDADRGRRSVVDLRGTTVVDLLVNEHAHGQMSSRLKIPKRYYDFMRFEVPTLLDQNVNRLLRHHPGTDVGKNWMVRTLDQKARAFLSDVYRDIDNLDVAEVALRVLSGDEEAGGGGLGARVVSCGLSDTHLYIKATTPHLRAEVKRGDEVCAGVVIKNSEVGAGSLVVAPRVYRCVCDNGMIVETTGEGMMRQIHLGARVTGVDSNRVIFRDETRRARDRAFMMEVADVIRTAVDEVRFRDLVSQMSRAAATEPLEDVGAAVKTLQKREGFSDGETSSVLTHLAEGGDLSLWGVLNAVTRTAQDAENYDRSTHLEAIGGKVLQYSERDWRALVTAA